MEYHFGRHPQAWIESPPIVESQGPENKLAHVYRGEDIRPCFFDPRSNEWTPRRFLGATAIPWLLEWLMSYELWLATGQWFGGGVDHGPAA